MPLQVRAGLTRVDALLWCSLLVVLLVGMRCVGTLGPTSLRWTLPLGFLLMMVLPWLVLTAPGRRQVGLQFPRDRCSWLVALALGSVAAMLCYLVGAALFGTSADFWFVSVADSYRRAVDTRGMDLLILHLVFTLPACFFSPLGEEMFFRGLLPRALEDRFSRSTSTALEVSLFGLVHLCHHGLSWGPSGLLLRPLSGGLWVLLMVATALLFAWLRQRYDSLFPAILAHVAFNATMNVCIFAALW